MSMHALISEMRERAALQPYNDMALLAIRWADALEAWFAGGGEAVAQLTTYEDTNSFSARMHDVVHDLTPGTYNLYLHPDGAVQVTDEMVERALCAYYSYGITWKEAAKLGGDLMADMRAALTAALNPGGSRE